MTAKKKKTTKKPSRILVYLDFEAKNKALLKLVARLAQRDGAEVLVLTALRDLHWYSQAGTAHGETIRKILEEDARTKVEKAAAFLAKAGVKTGTQVAWGRPFQVIIQEALRRPTQMVMKTAHRDAAGEASLFGSTGMHLFRKCPVPVWVVKPRSTKRLRRVLAAVDPVQPSQHDADLNVEILRHASAIAAAEDAELHVCHAFAILGAPTLRKSMVWDDYRAYQQNVMETVESAMSELISDVGLGLDDKRVHILKGDPSRVIPALVSKQKTSLLVMGTIARAGIPGLLIGNTAEKMLRAVDCSVLAVKPAGFVSPIEPVR